MSKCLRPNHFCEWWNSDEYVLSSIEYVDGLAQYCSSAIANTLTLLQSLSSTIEVIFFVLHHGEAYLYTKLNCMRFLCRVSIPLAKGRLFSRSRKISKPWVIDWKVTSRSEIWQASWCPFSRCGVLITVHESCEANSIWKSRYAFVYYEVDKHMINIS